MTRNQKYLKLGTGYASDKTRRRIAKRGLAYVQQFRTAHAAKVSRAQAARAALLLAQRETAKQRNQSV